MNTKLLKLCFLLTCITGLFASTQINAQNIDLSGRIWIYSDSCGIDFRDTNNVVPYTNIRLISPASFATVSTPDGTLAFYTDNQKIMDGNNQFVLNYDSNSTGNGYRKGFFFVGV
jgi:hypothetical protein